MITDRPPTREKDGVRIWEWESAGESSVAYVQVAPGAHIRPHFHKRTHEAYIIDRGAAVFNLSNRVCFLRGPSVIEILPATVHSLETTEGISFWVVTTPPYDPEDHYPAE